MIAVGCKTTGQFLGTKYIKKVENTFFFFETFLKTFNYSLT